MKALEGKDTSNMTEEALNQMISDAVDSETLLQLDEQSVPLSDATLESLGRSWQSQNHSVLLLGWGVEPTTNTKYWIIRNSYSAKWGMKGDFLMKRGSNDFGIEADIIAFDPVLCDENNKEKCDHFENKGIFL